MKGRFFSNPDDDYNLFDALIGALNSGIWDEFRAAVAFVKLSGTKYVAGPIEDFSEHGRAQVVAGIDLKGSTLEALTMLLEALGNNGELFIFHNRGPSRMALH